VSYGTGLCQSRMPVMMTVDVWGSFSWFMVGVGSCCLISRCFGGRNWIR
jgi:hypothetical protein